MLPLDRVNGRLDPTKDVEHDGETVRERSLHEGTLDEGEKPPSLLTTMTSCITAQPVTTSRPHPPSVISALNGPCTRVHAHISQSSHSVEREKPHHSRVELSCALPPPRHETSYDLIHTACHLSSSPHRHFRRTAYGVSRRLRRSSRRFDWPVSPGGEKKKNALLVRKSELSPRGATLGLRLGWSRNSVTEGEPPRAPQSGSGRER